MQCNSEIKALKIEIEQIQADAKETKQNDVQKESTHRNSGEIDSLKADHEYQISDFKSRQEHEFDARIPVIDSRHTGELASLKADHEREITALKKLHEQELEIRILAAQEQESIRLNDSNEKYLRTFRNEKESLRSSVNALEEKYKEEQTKVAALKKQNDQNETAIRQNTLEHAEYVGSIKTELEALEEKYKDEQEKVKVLKKQIEQIEADTKDTKQNHVQNESTLQSALRLSEELAAMSCEHEQAVTIIKAKHKHHVEALVTEVAALEKKFEQHKAIPSFSAQRILFRAWTDAVQRATFGERRVCGTGSLKLIGAEQKRNRLLTQGFYFQQLG